MSIELMISIISVLFSAAAFCLSIFVWRRDIKPDISVGFGEDYDISDQYEARPEKIFYIDIVNNSPRKVQIRKIDIEWRKSLIPVFTKTKKSTTQQETKKAQRNFGLSLGKVKNFAMWKRTF